MGVVSYIRKYNHRINDLRTDLKKKVKTETFTAEQIQVVNVEIDVIKGFIKDLEYIDNSMPTINPIPKGEYNDAPEGLKEIPLNEWQRGMFHYCLFQPQSKQVRGKETFDLRLFDVPNFDNKKLGYAIMNDWFDKEEGKNRPEHIIRFCRYGLDEDWTSFERRFASQFTGDNS